jgi:hypothetical protein
MAKNPKKFRERYQFCIVSYTTSKEHPTSHILDVEANNEHDARRTVLEDFHECGIFVLSIKLNIAEV